VGARRVPGPRQRGAGKPGAGKAGRGGGMPNVQQMMAQVQRMQQDMEAAQEQLKDETVTASAGGGMVSVEVSGDLRVTSVRIDPEAVDPEDVDMLADMVLAAVNEGLRSAQELASSMLGGATGDLDLGALGEPGGLGGLGGLGGMPGLQS
jgi:nucleoid-associated protein EbfC